MKKLLIILILIICSCRLLSQQKGDNLILVKGVSFMQVCSALLDSGYSIEKKDDQLQTVKTEFKEYPTKFNGAYFIEVRVKDSVAYIKGKFSAPWSKSILAPNVYRRDPFFNQEKVIYDCNKNGRPVINLTSYPFSFINSFAKSLNGDIVYKKE